ncbi:MAG: hypothetical protein ABSF95_03870 [Verrucomicrobiota bacterium]|jgi:hypothetical protein
MCDYNTLSKATVQALPAPLTNLRQYLGPPAHRKLLQAITSGHARPGHDLYDGSPLPPGSLVRGHYMSPANFQRAVARMSTEPQRCQWCGGTLPPDLVRQHQEPHNEREEIVHHFHSDCWRARLVAVAAIFGHVRPEQLLARHVSHLRMLTLRKTVTWTVQRVFTANMRSRSRNHRRWRG